MSQYLSKEKIEKLEKELALLKTERRQEIIERMAAAKEMGDLSENAEYADAREAQAFNEGRILELEALLREAEVREGENSCNGKVALGCVVTVSNGQGDHQFTIVSSSEADPMENLISHESPLGQVLLGRKVGETVKYKKPSGGEIEYKILNIK